MMKSNRIKQLVLLVLMGILIVSGKPMYATEITTENSQNQVAISSPLVPPRLEMKANDFTISSEDAKKITTEILLDATHANITFPNQITRINLIPLVEVNPQDLSEIQKGLEGVYPVTLTLDYNNEKIETTLMVTIEETKSSGNLAIYLLISGPLLLLIALFLMKKQKQK